MSNNPFRKTDPVQEPRYGNAYDTAPVNAYDTAPVNAYDTAPVNAYESTPNAYEKPPTFDSTGYNNAWGDESNKTEYNDEPMPAPSPIHVEPPIQHNAYKYTGTPYATSKDETAYSPVSTEEAHVVGPETWNGEVYKAPSKGRFWLRFIVLLASIGHLGFAAGARPYSGQEIPFYTPACFYYLFAVAAFSIVWTCMHIFNYCFRTVSKKSKLNRPLMLFIDLLMAVLWGIGVIIEVIRFQCTEVDKFCTFYNVSIFFGFLAFASYILILFFDIFGGKRNKRK